MIRLVAATLLTIAALAILSKASAQTLDPSFGNGGFATVTDQAPGLLVTDVEIDSKRRPLVTYSSATGTTDLAYVSRMTSGGSPDGTFGDGGRVRIDRPGSQETIRRVAVLPDESLLVAGQSLIDGSPQTAALLARVSANGVVLTTWTYVFGDRTRATDVAVLRGGQLFALAIDFRGGGGVERCGVLVVRPDGSPFSGFGNQGFSELLTGRGCRSAGVEPSGDGVVIAGTREGQDGDDDLFVARFDSAGRADGAFGFVVGGFGDTEETATDLSVGPAGDFLVSGRGLKGTVPGLSALRVRPDGRPASFGAGGAVFAAFSDGGRSYAPTLVPSGAIDADGRVLLVASTLSPSRLSITRFRPDGALDPEFGSDSVFQLPEGPVPGPPTTGAAITFDADHRAVFAGSYSVTSTSQRVLVGRLGSDVAPTSGEGAPHEEALLLAPNPTRGTASLTLDRPSRLLVFDPLGREVLSQEAAPGRLALDLGHLSPGVYTVLVEHEEARTATRLTVVR